MKLAFFGTGEFSKNILKGILDMGTNTDVCLVVSQPDKPVGRDKKVIETPIKKFSIENNIEVLQPVKLRNNEEFFDKLRKLNLDFIIVVAYGKIMPKEILEIPKYGCINIHGSILPKYRGASPIQESLKNGDKKTGLTIMYMSEGMDEGDILKIEEIDVDNVDKTGDIFNKFEKIGPKLLINTLNGIVDGNIKGIPQDNSKATYCKKIEKENGYIDFKNETSFEIYNKFKAYYNWPGIYTFFEGKKLNLEEISIVNNTSESRQTGQVIKLENKKIGVICADNKVILIEKVKLEGKKSMSTIDFINGNKSFINAIL
ncbi:MAG: methionyl-tRNA formyltransferase [Candidatus Gracilibacteria bacterium]